MHRRPRPACRDPEFRLVDTAGASRAGPAVIAPEPALTRHMKQLLDLDRFPLDRPDGAGGRARIIAVFSYYETPDVTFSDTERLGFYGRRGEIE